VASGTDRPPQGQGAPPVRPQGDREPSVDWPVFAITAATVLGVCLLVFLSPDRAGVVITDIHGKLTRNLGFLYQWYVIALLGFLAFIAFSRHGKIRLGGRDARPDFSTLSWIGMIFCAGVGATLIYWAVVEWAYYIDAPPLGAAPRSTAAIEWAATYGMFHWGPVGWAIFCLPTIAIAYAFYQRGEPHLRLSAGCLPFLPGGVGSVRGRIIDFIYMANLIGGSATALALTAPMIAALFGKLTGVPQSFAVEAAVVFLCVLIFAASSYLGLERGFKRLADANTWIALGLLGFVVTVGPTIFILQMGTNSLGLMLQEFVRMVTWTDPVERKGVVENWTVFYWAWWVAYGPFVALFATRISRGRTLRELIGGLMVFGTLGAALFYIVLGNYALDLELTGALEVARLVQERSGAVALAEVLGTLPFPTLVMLGFLVVAAILMATTYDSASYTLASVSSRDIRVGQDPARWNRVFWAFAIGVPPVALLFVKGGITVVQSATIIVSLPLLVVGMLLAISIIRMIREDETAGRL
jgi:BCCT family betaine/carnitine transporter